MVLGEILDTTTGHLEKDEASRGTLVEVESTKFTLVHTGSSLVVGHEDEATELRPGVDGLLDATHHEGGKTAALESLEDEDISEVGKGDVVGDKTGKADEGQIGERRVAGEATVV